jgi:hypothetical protein
MATGSILNYTQVGDAALAKPVYMAVFDYSGNASYTTGGDDLDLATITGTGLPNGATILHVFFEMSDAATAHLFRYDAAAKKVLAYLASTGVQVAGAVDLSTVTAKGIVIAS